MKKLIVSVALASLLATGAVFANEGAEHGKKAHPAHAKKKAKEAPTATEGAAPAAEGEAAHPTH